MKKEIIQKIIIPEGIEAEINGSTLSIKGKEGESSREFKTDGLSCRKQKINKERKENDKHNKIPY